MSNRVGKRERMARKRNKKRSLIEFKLTHDSGWQTLKLGSRKLREFFKKNSPSVTVHR